MWTTPSARPSTMRMALGPPGWQGATIRTSSGEVGWTARARARYVHPVSPDEVRLVAPVHPGGSYETYLVRRKRMDNEGPDDVQRLYRAELVPFALKVAADPVSGKPTALCDLTGFSAWAKNGEAARVTFRRDRPPELMSMSVILGTSVNIELRSV